MRPDLVLLSTLNGSNYPYLEQFYGPTSVKVVNVYHPHKRADRDKMSFAVCRLLCVVCRSF